MRACPTSRRFSTPIRPSIIDSTAGGMFRLQFGDKPMSRQEIAGLMTRLQNEKIINLAAPAQ